MKNYKEISDRDIGKIANKKITGRFGAESTVGRVKCINKVLHYIFRFKSINEVLRLTKDCRFRCFAPSPELPSLRSGNFGNPRIVN